MSPAQLHEKYGEPEPEPVVRVDGKPLLPGVSSHAIVLIWLGEAGEQITLTESRILIIDFDEAFSYQRGRKYGPHIPLAIRPPEA